MATSLNVAASRSVAVNRNVAESLSVVGNLSVAGSRSSGPVVSLMAGVTRTILRGPGHPERMQPS